MDSMENRYGGTNKGGIDPWVGYKNIYTWSKRQIELLWNRDIFTLSEALDHELIGIW
jgi:hypothetical protein